MTPPRKLIIDTDPGIDDAMAIFYALASPEFDVIGLTTVFGNCHTDVCTTNALRLLDIAGRPDIPVAHGATRPLAMEYRGPVEFVHGQHKALINQRELEVDTNTFANALKHVLRQDPDVILVGEMRDAETIRMAMTAAETGHLVFGTLHTTTAASTPSSFIWAGAASGSLSDAGCEIGPIAKPSVTAFHQSLPASASWNASISATSAASSFAK